VAVVALWLVGGWRKRRRERRRSILIYVSVNVRY
jgi:hypothetical protein